MYQLSDRITVAFVREQRHHQAQRGGHDPEVEDQVVEEGEGRGSLSGCSLYENSLWKILLSTTRVKLCYNDHGYDEIKYN